MKGPSYFINYNHVKCYNYPVVFTLVCVSVCLSLGSDIVTLLGVGPVDNVTHPGNLPITRLVLTWHGRPREDDTDGPYTAESQAPTPPMSLCFSCYVFFIVFFCSALPPPPLPPDNLYVVSSPTCENL